MDIAGKEIRKRNGVRRMLELEQGQDLARANGVYGFATSFSLEYSLVNPNYHSGLILLRDANTSREIELHKSSKGDIMILVYFNEVDAARLGQIEREVGEVFGFFKDDEKHSVLVAIPLSRVRDWDSRLDAEFAVINID